MYPYGERRICGDLEDILRSFKLDVLFIGDEYVNKQFIGRDYYKQKDILLFYNIREKKAVI